jgi:outer membrane lipoprotein-sorting protein
MNSRLTMASNRLHLNFLLLTGAIVVCSALSSSRVLAEEPISDLLTRLDQTARSFTGATAEIRVVTHTGVINKDEVQTGTVVLRRDPSGRLSFLLSFVAPDPQEIALRKNKLEVYYPKLNSIREYDLGKYKDIVQKLILLGFGMRGQELRASYDIADLGNEHIESQATTHIQLTPKSPEVVKQLSRVDLWISLKNNCPVQQKFYMSAGDYRLVTYSNVAVNPRLPASVLNLPKGAKRERMN